MSHRFRLLAVGTTTALMTGMLGLAGPPAHATTSRTLDYDCAGVITQLLTIPGGVDPVTQLPILMTVPFPLPVTTSVPLTVTMPDTAALGDLAPGESVPAIAMTGALDVGWLLGMLGSTLQTVSTSVALPLTGATGAPGLTLGTAGPLGRGGLLGGTALPLAGTITAFTAPATVGSYPISLPTTFSLPLTTMTGGVSASDVLTCTAAAAVTAADRVLTTLVVRVAGPGGGSGAGTGVVGGHPAVGTSAADPCVATPAARPGQRTSRLRAHAHSVSSRTRPVIAVSVATRGKPARGRVIACYGALRVGQARLRHGGAALRTLRFHPGRHRVKVVYLGRTDVRATARTIGLRVTR